jgi:hypothetical protein
MPTFVQSAMNPNGTWQGDAMDQSEQANRQAAFQSAQMQNEIAARQLQAHLEQARMAQQGSQFEEGRADTLGMHGQDIENQNRMQQAGFGQADSMALREIAARNHIADLEHGPNSIEARRYQAEIDDRRHLQEIVFGGGQPAHQAAPSSDLAPMHAMPADMAHNPMAGYGNGAMPSPTGAGVAPAAPGAVDPDMLKRVAIYNAMAHGGSMPDFEGNALRHRADQLTVDRASREDAAQRIQSALDAGDVHGAQAIAQGSGAQMPRIDSGALMSRPEVAVKLANAVTMAKGLIGNSFAGPEDLQKLKWSFDDATNTLVNHGVSPDEAKAAIAQQISAVIPERESGVKAAIGRVLGYSFVLPMLSGSAGSGSRANQIHDTIGF